MQYFISHDVCKELALISDFLFVYINNSSI